MSEDKQKEASVPLPERLEVILTALKQYGVPWIEEAIGAARLNDELNLLIGEMRGQIAELESVDQSSKRTLAEVVLDNTKLRNQIANGVSGDTRTALKERDLAVAELRSLKLKLLEAEVTVQRKRGAKVLDMLSKQTGEGPAKG